MIEREIAFLQSMNKTVDLCTRKSDDFKDLPSFTNDVLRLKTVAADISKENQVLEVSTQGFTNAKNASKEILLKDLNPPLKRIQAYASVSKNQVLQQAVKLTDTKLSKIHESMLSSTCRSIFELCQANLAELQVYGLTPAMLTALENSIVDFEAKLIGTPKYKGEQKAAKQNIDRFFAEASDLLKNKLDVLAEIIKDTYPETYVEYKSSRKLVITAGRSLALKGRITEAGTGKPMAGVTVTIVKNGNGEMKAAAGADLSKTVKRTAAQGGFQLKSLPAGAYTITASKAGYADQSVIVYINDGETGTGNLELPPL